jgi:hypothetical protein
MSQPILGPLVPGCFLQVLHGMVEQNGHQDSVEPGWHELQL